jgi:hypothetical protein
MMGVERTLVMLAVVATLNLFAEGEPKMPMLNWMGREKATKSVKDVVMKILREDKSLSYMGGLASPRAVTIENGHLHEFV